jgi:hypothetical protein
MVNETPHLIIVAYAVAPGPGGPEGHVNARFLQALANYWPAGVSVITAGEDPLNDVGRRLAGLPGWQYYSLGEAGDVGGRTTYFSKVATWCLRQIRDQKPGRIFAKIFNRAIYMITGSGIKMLAWRQTAKRILKKELRCHPDAIVYSRALPFESILAVANLRKNHPFPWLANINDPLPPDVWGGLYHTAKWSNKRMRAAFKKSLPLVDAFTFPCRRLRDVELAAFPEMKNVPVVILPHLTKICSFSHSPRNTVKGGEALLRIAFAGTLRKKRVQGVFADALHEFVRKSPQLAETLQITFHLARPNPHAEAFIRSLPIHTKITLGCFDDHLDQELVNAHVLMDIEAEEDKPLSLTKVVNYLGYQKPIWAICMPNGTTWELVTKHNLGYYSPLWDCEAILSSLFEICQDWRRGRFSEKCPSAEVLERFGPKAQIEDLLALTMNVGSKSKTRFPVREIPIKDWP